MDKTILVEGVHGTGGQKDNFDNRDHQYGDIASATLPFDWSVGFNIETKLSTILNIPGFKIPVKNQGSSSSCGGQAWSYYAEVLEAIATGTFEERSAKYLYAQSHVEGGGSSGRANADIFKNQGVAREVVLSSQPATEANLTNSHDITDPIRQDAKSDVSISYAQTDGDIDTIAQAIRDNNGVVCGIDGQNNGTWLSVFPKPPTISEWRHWVYFGKAKLINGVKYIGLLNSWGDTVGEKGWQWINQDYISTVLPTSAGNETALWAGWTHILKVQTPQPSTMPFNIDMSYGTTSDEVARLQSFLKQLGYFNQEVTGYYGTLTRNAVYAFQISHVNLSWWDKYITVGKKVGPLTRAALNSLIK